MRLKDTEMMEHGMSLSTLQNIYILNKFFADNPDVMTRFEDYKAKYYDERDSSDFPFDI